MKKYEALVKKSPHTSVITKVYIADDIDEIIQEIRELSLHFKRDELLNLLDKICKERKTET
jgi:hypothetical protein